MSWSRESCWEQSAKRLAFSDRQENQDFDVKEVLYFRFSHPLCSGRRIPQEDIRWPHDNGTSCNRSGYSRAQDVLFPNWYDEGVFSIPHDLVLGEHASPLTGQVVVIRLFHSPTTVKDKVTGDVVENYAHSDLRSFGKKGKPKKRKKITCEIIKTKVRATIAETAEVISEPKMRGEFSPMH